MTDLEETQFIAEPGDHYFGGDWTADKLDRLRKYLSAYATIMSGKFNFFYIDAFAGTGYISKEQSTEQENLFAELGEPEPRAFLSGSAKVALEIEPGFSKYIFVEMSASRCIELEKLGSEHPALSSRIQVVKAEANSYLQDLCRNYSWVGNRAVLFLDPYGMQVEWRTIEAIAATKAIDMWLLFPLGISINRLLRKDASIPQAWANRLDTIFGTHDWYNAFYTQEQQQTLFGPETSTVKTSDFAAISSYFIQRLKTIFPFVAENPLTLRNSRNNPLFLLCFAAGNKKGGPIAKKIAEHILGK